MDSEVSFTAIAPPVFYGTNYQMWAIRMEAYLDANDLWEAIEQVYEAQPLPNNPTVAQIRTQNERKQRRSKAKKWVTAGGLGTVLLTLTGCEHVRWWSSTIMKGDDREAVHIPNHKFTVLAKNPHVEQQIQKIRLLWEIVNRPYLLIEPSYKINGDDKSKASTSPIYTNEDKKAQPEGASTSDSREDLKRGSLSSVDLKIDDQVQVKFSANSNTISKHSEISTSNPQIRNLASESHKHDSTDKSTQRATSKIPPIMSESSNGKRDIKSSVSHSKQDGDNIQCNNIAGTRFNFKIQHR
ncbi:hypothetical protein FEM48_Zijuj06G0152100 [Ziziphus jujuba var. spinosa]|uniref:DUF4219 domain-containing protein n=1 Tax=Ziziphus jujuba var. spinosa TaxID=714518 RepID=A0A978VA11_ZIZJJ|nr:hypothetical protein FEM48_Zijuj06G0152100 [Ziziphus jujuba var. spinosa]